MVAKGLSRQSYGATAACLQTIIGETQRQYKDLYAVLKFIPKKNGLNPLLAAMREGGPPPSLGDVKPREARRALEDLSRALEQTWLLLSCYLTLPTEQLRSDMLWAARIVVEKVKTDQRSRCLELLCLGFYGRDARLRALIGSRDPCAEPPCHGLVRDAFETGFGVEQWTPQPDNAKLVWERSRMVFPFLELAHRAWLAGSGVGCGTEGCEVESSQMAFLLDRIARAGPEEKVINSLLYILIDLTYRAMLQGEPAAPRWAPEPFVLRRPGVEARLVEELAALGHLLALMAEGAAVQDGPELLVTVKQLETTSTLLGSIRATCADSCELALQDVLADHARLMKSPELTLARLEKLEYDALGALLGVDGAAVAARGRTVRRAISEWRNPELLFRYLDANSADERMRPLIVRWLLAIFGISHESLRMIRRESPENIRHLIMIPQDVLLRWYSQDCPGTSKCKTLFMVGEDAGSCLRIISNEGNRYNRALLGYVLQSHVRALVVMDKVGRLMARSIIRLVLRSDTLTPVIFCDPMFFTLGYSRVLQLELLRQARELAAHMQVPVVHAGSVLPVLNDGELGDGFSCDAGPQQVHFECYTRHSQALDYDVVWVDLLEMDGVAPYSYSEELPFDELLQQHRPGVQTRTAERPMLVVAALPRADSRSAARYVAERRGETAWTMDIDDEALGAPAPRERRAHMPFDPNARREDEDTELPPLPANYVPPRLDA